MTHGTLQPARRARRPRGSRLIVASCALLGLLASGRVAHAQYWLSDRAASEGRGIRIGDFELHPGVALEGGYDSNTLAQPDNCPAAMMGQPCQIPSIRLRATGHISLSTLGANRTAGAANGSPGALPTIAFRTNLALWYNYFADVPGSVSADATAQGQLNGINGLGGDLGFLLHVFPGRTFQFRLTDDVSRIAQGGPDFGVNLFVYDRWLNVGGFSVIAAPNGGILDVRLEYLNYFTAYTSSGFGFLTNDANQIALRSRWRFLPKTALLWEATFTPTFYVNTTGSSTGLFNSYPMSTRFGLNGLLSERVALLAMLGWTATYFQLGDNASTPVGQLEFRYIFGPLTSFRAGFIRDVNPSALGNYYIRNGLYLGINQSFSGRFYVSAELSGGYWQYGFIATPGGMVDSTNYTGADDATGRFHSWRIMGTLFGEYRPTDIIGINATIVGSSNISNVNVNLPVAPGMGAVSESLSWNKLEAYLGVRVNW